MNVTFNLATAAPGDTPMNEKLRAISFVSIILSVGALIGGAALLFTAFTATTVGVLAGSIGFGLVSLMISHDLAVLHSNTNLANISALSRAKVYNESFFDKFPLIQGVSLRLLSKGTLLFNKILV